MTKRGMRSTKETLVDGKTTINAGAVYPYDITLNPLNMAVKKMLHKHNGSLITKLHGRY